MGADNGAGDSVTAVEIGLTGVYIVGEFLGYRPQEPRTVGQTTYHNVDIGVVCGGAIVTVQYQDKERAESAAGEARERDLVALKARPVYGATKDGRPYLFWMAERDGRVDPAEFSI